MFAGKRNMQAVEEADATAKIHRLDNMAKLDVGQTYSAHHYSQLLPPPEPVSARVHLHQLLSRDTASS
jgi:hypothetical protein